MSGTHKTDHRCPTTPSPPLKNTRNIPHKQCCLLYHINIASANQIIHAGRCIQVNWVSFSSGNSLSPGRRQAIARTNAELSTGPCWTSLNEIWIKIHFFSLNIIHFKMSDKRQPFCQIPSILKWITKQYSTEILSILFSSFHLINHSANYFAVCECHPSHHWDLALWCSAGWCWVHMIHHVSQYGHHQVKLLFFGGIFCYFLFFIYLFL